MPIYKRAWVNEAGGTGPTCVTSGKLFTFVDSNDVYVRFRAENGRTALVPGRKYVIGAQDTGTHYDLQLVSVTESPTHIVLKDDEAVDLGIKTALFRR